MNQIAQLLRTNKYLNFFASVKLAVPLMIVLIVTVAIGTIFESLYNSDYAKMAIYQTNWFFCLLALLWVNIFLAALSRWPFKIHHFGFVVTHIGLLTLLIGAFITSLVGLDASLSITEGQQNSTMVLPETVIGYQFVDANTANTMPIERRLSSFTATKDSSVNSSIRHLFFIKNYLPFVQASRVVAPSAKGAVRDPNAGIGVSFRMKSKFFEVSEWLHSQENPGMSLGPARLEIKVGKYDGQGAAAAKSATKKSARKPQSEPQPQAQNAPARQPQATNAGGDKIKIIENKTQKVVGERSAKEVAQHSWSVVGLEVRIKQVFKHAMVGANKIAEGPGPEDNPAYELEIKKGGETKREILFVKYPSFSINPEGVFGYRVTLNAQAISGTAEMNAAHGANIGSNVGANAGAAGAAPTANTVDVSAGVNDHGTSSAQPTNLPAGHPQIPPKGGAMAPAEEPASQEAAKVAPGAPPPMGSNRNVIEFWVDPNSDDDSAEIVLKKEGQLVAHDKIIAGQTYQTPWMGMTVTLASIVRGGQTRVAVQPIEPTKGKNLPPSAVEIELADGSDSFWLTEGSAQQVTLAGRQAQIFFDRKTIDLPFQMKLIKFTKKDYPGTETPMSYESLVELPATGINNVISMNEPLKKDGYTIYQASFILEEGRAPESIFSVNDDPGRPVKYIGSIILAFGIISFTVMRSDWYLQRLRNKKAVA